MELVSAGEVYTKISNFYNQNQNKLSDENLSAVDDLVRLWASVAPSSTVFYDPYRKITDNIFFENDEPEFKEFLGLFCRPKNNAKLKELAFIYLGSPFATYEVENITNISKKMLQKLNENDKNFINDFYTIILGNHILGCCIEQYSFIRNEKIYYPKTLNELYFLVPDLSKTTFYEAEFKNIIKQIGQAAIDKKIPLDPKIVRSIRTGKLDTILPLKNMIMNEYFPDEVEIEIPKSWWEKMIDFFNDLFV